MQISLFVQRPTICVLVVLSLLVGCIRAHAADPGPGEKRQRYTAASPVWLLAVGKLQIPTSRVIDGERGAYIENCSATLVATPGAQAADTIVTAWHCLEHYRDISRDIHFTLIDPAGKRTQRKATRLYDGGGMHADWAVMRLQQSVPQKLAQPLQMLRGDLDWAQPLSMAGFSRDAGLGGGGVHLTYDPRCAITGRSGHALDTSCQAYKGASGGAVIQVDADGVARFGGVISAGDGVGLSRFVPVARFRNPLMASLVQRRQ